MRDNDEWERCRDISPVSCLCFVAYETPWLSTWKTYFVIRSYITYIAQYLFAELQLGFYYSYCIYLLTVITRRDCCTTPVSLGLRLYFVFYFEFCLFLRDERSAVECLTQRVGTCRFYGVSVRTRGIFHHGISRYAARLAFHLVTLYTDICANNEID
jgi:hypothetical protein